MGKIDKKHSRLIVVDTSVARAAGYSENLVSSSCREALIAIKKICHRLVMTNSINNEWEKHKSLLSDRWLASMCRLKGKVNDVKIDTKKWNPPDLNSLRISNNDRKALEKDLLLIEAAACSDGIILTLDTTAIKIWEKCKNHFNCSKRIRWINPLEKNCITKLESLSKNKFK